MKNFNLAMILLSALIVAACSGTGNGNNEEAEAQEHQHQADPEVAVKKKPASPKQQAMAIIGNNHIHIDYSSPSVRGRVIWGGLVAYEKVWSTGAHKATSINFPEPVVINDIDIPAGKYGFFTIPGKETWTVILNKNWDMHLADDYQEADDILRFEVIPEKLEDIQEALEYKVESAGDETGTISMAWEYLIISFDFTNH